MLYHIQNRKKHSFMIDGYKVNESELLLKKSEEKVEEKKLKWKTKHSQQFNIEEASVETIKTLLKNFESTSQKRKYIKLIQKNVDLCPDTDLEAIFPENSIISELIEISFSDSRLIRRDAINLLVSLAKPSPGISRIIYEAMNFFSELEKSSFNSIQILQLITIFLSYCDDLSADVLKYNLLPYLFSEVTNENASQELMDECLNFMLELVGTRNIFNPDYEEKWLEIFELCNDFVSFLFIKKKDANPKVMKLRVNLLKALASMPNVQTIESVISPSVAVGIFEGIGSEAYCADYIEFLGILVDQNPGYLVQFISDSPILNSLIRHLNNHDLYITVLDFLTNFVCISDDSCNLLIDFKVFDFLADEDNTPSHKETEELSYTPTLITSLSVSNIDSEKKKATLNFFLALCRMMPITMIEGEHLDEYLVMCFDSLNLFDEDFVTSYVVALRSLFENGMSEERLHDLQEIGEWLEDCVSNSENETISENAQFILEKYMDPDKHS